MPAARPVRTRTLLIALGALLLVLALVPFLPDAPWHKEGLAPTGKGELRAAKTAGYGALTPAMTAEIQRVLDQTGSAPRLSRQQAARTPISTLVARSTRCATFEGQRYCLGVGWTDSTESEVQSRTVAAARATLARAGDRHRPEQTGDLDALAAVRRTATLSPTRRQAAEQAELVQAARSVAKVWLIRHEIQGVPLPDGFLERHPEALARSSAGAAPALPTTTPTLVTPTPTPVVTMSGSPVVATSPAKTPTATATPTAPATPEKTFADYPVRDAVLDPSQVAEQERSYWCGPTTMQMITWGWKQRDKGQTHWATKLGTTTSGTAITSMVSVVNKSTGWDKDSYAGPYVALDIGDFSYEQWLLLIMRHITDYRAPIVMHPLLRKEFYAYLDDDASGHFQAGRGYKQMPGKNPKVGYFEPWNQQRFDPSEPFIKRVQWHNAYRSYRANQVHFQHNIGV